MTEESDVTSFPNEWFYLAKAANSIVPGIIPDDVDTKEGVHKHMERARQEKRLDADKIVAISVKAHELMDADTKKRVRDLVSDAFNDEGNPAAREREDRMVHKMLYRMDTKGSDTMSDSISTNDVLGQGLPSKSDSWGSGRVRVKQPSERLSTKRYDMKHPKTGEPVHFRGEPIQSLSEFDKMKLYSWLRYGAMRTPGFTVAGQQVQMHEYEKQLFAEMKANDVWIAANDDGHEYVWGRKATDLIDDSTSGGENLVPEWFDQMIVQFPLLHSELLPYVEQVDMPRGSTVETASIGNPNLTWSKTDGQSLVLFDTDALVAAITASVFPVACAITIGNDFVADANPLMVVDRLTENLFQRMAQELDKVIANGDGTTQPQGIMQASGTTDVSIAGGTSGSVTINDSLNLMFGISKVYRSRQMAARYCMTDTSYKRFRAVATGVTGDTRFVLGNDVQSYEMLESPVSIEQEGIDDQDAIYGAFSKYRLWRRQGAQRIFENAGQTLRLKNESLLMIRGRYAGKVVDANAFAVADNLPA